MTAPPAHPKVYHIVHVDRLASILADEHLWCDAEIVLRSPIGTTIGMSSIKKRRLQILRLSSYPDLNVGDCVPFYFCPRSIMLFMIYCRNNPEMIYKGGQDPIVHLEADLRKTVDWADSENLRWAFTLSNAGASYFEDRCDLSQLGEINWAAVEARDWRDCKEGKQAEFLLERRFPWHPIERIGVHSAAVYSTVSHLLRQVRIKPRVEVIPDWYY